MQLTNDVPDSQMALGKEGSLTPGSIRWPRPQKGLHEGEAWCLGFASASQLSHDTTFSPAKKGLL